MFITHIEGIDGLPLRTDKWVGGVNNIIRWRRQGQVHSGHGSRGLWGGWEGKPVTLRTPHQKALRKFSRCFGHIDSCWKINSYLPLTQSIHRNRGGFRVRMRVNLNRGLGSDSWGCYCLLFLSNFCWLDKGKWKNKRMHFKQKIGTKQNRMMDKTNLVMCYRLTVCHYTNSLTVYVIWAPVSNTITMEIDLLRFVSNQQPKYQYFHLLWTIKYNKNWQ